MMRFLIAILGLVIVFLLAYAWSNDRKNIKYRPLAVMVVVQLILGFVFLNTSFGAAVIGFIATVFENLMAYAGEGVDFVFGDMANEGKSPFFLTTLLPIVVVSAIIGILQYLKILPFIVKYIGLILSKINGMGKLESYNGVASAILGQSEVFISVKKQLAYLPKYRLYTLGASAMSTVSMSIVGAYMNLIEPTYVVTAIALNLFGGFMIASILNPYTVSAEEDNLKVQEGRKQSFFEMLGEYIMDGFKVAVTVGAMLIGFIALIALVNGIFNAIFGISFQEILGYIFAPLAFIMGIPWADLVQSGSLMATKMLTNEFVAMEEISEIDTMSARATGIVSIFLVSFANFSSIGIIVGAVKGLNEEKGNEIATFGLKLLYGATLVSTLSAIIASLYL